MEHAFNCKNCDQILNVTSNSITNCSGCYELIHNACQNMMYITKGVSEHEDDIHIGKRHSDKIDAAFCMKCAQEMIKRRLYRVDLKIQ